MARISSFVIWRLWKVVSFAKRISPSEVARRARKRIGEWFNDPPMNLEAKRRAKGEEKERAKKIVRTFQIRSFLPRVVNYVLPLC